MDDKLLQNTGRSREESRTDALSPSQDTQHQDDITTNNDPSDEYIDLSDSSVDSDEYDFVEREVLPTALFPGTWDAAYHNTASAIEEVGKASRSYCNAVANSGLSKAAWSIGGAMAGTVKRSALSVVSLAVSASRTDQNRLPQGFQNWLKGKEKLDAAKRRAEDAKRARLAWKYRRELIESGRYVDAPPSRFRSQVSGRDERVIGESGSDMLPIGQFRETNSERNSLRRRRSSPSDLTSDLPKFMLAEDSDEEREKGVQTEPLPGNPWVGTGNPNSPAIHSPFGTYRRPKTTPVSVKSRPPPFVEKKEESPYPDSDEEDLYFRG